MINIWVRCRADAAGGYVDAAGLRYTLEWCIGMVTPDGSGPADHGYESHPSVEAAAYSWGLSVYVDPEAAAEFEALTYNEETNEY